MKFGESDAPFHLVSDGMSFEEFKNLYFATGLEDEEAVKTVSRFHFSFLFLK